MTEHDRATARREITDALLKALDRRHEVLDVIVEADDKAAAVEAISTLLGTSQRGRRSRDGDVVRPAHQGFAPQDRRGTRGPEQAAHASPSATVPPARARAWCCGSSPVRPTVTSSPPALATSAPRATARVRPRAASTTRSAPRSARVSAEEAVWFVAEEGNDKVGMVFGELVGGEVNVRIWIHPDHRHRGFGTAALRRSPIGDGGVLPRRADGRPRARRRAQVTEPDVTDAALAAQVAQRSR